MTTYEADDVTNEPAADAVDLPESVTYTADATPEAPEGEPETKAVDTDTAVEES